MTKKQDQQPTWTVVIYGRGYWGCGNSHKEAVANARQNGFRKSDEHYLYLFTEPVTRVSAGFHGISWEWADKEGQHLSAHING